MLDKHSTIELQPQPMAVALKRLLRSSAFRTETLARASVLCVSPGALLDKSLAEVPAHVNAQESCAFMV